jgi:hypothetical protein
LAKVAAEHCAPGQEPQQPPRERGDRLGLATLPKKSAAQEQERDNREEEDQRRDDEGKRPGEAEQHSAAQERHGGAEAACRRLGALSPTTGDHER